MLVALAVATALAGPAPDVDVVYAPFPNPRLSRVTAMKAAGAYIRDEFDDNRDSFPLESYGVERPKDCTRRRIRVVTCTTFLVYKAEEGVVPMTCFYEIRVRKGKRHIYSRATGDMTCTA